MLLNTSNWECTCSDQQRKFKGTYCTQEVEVAINKGYKILQIPEVLHWQKSEKYNPDTKEGGLFTQYINCFLKLKQEASGYLEEVRSEDQKQRYIEDYLEHEGIQLDSAQIVKNPGLREAT